VNFKISKHAKDEIKRRRIPISLVESVLKNPQQIVEEYGNNKAYQSKVDFEENKSYLLRVIVNENVIPKKIITAYRTSKIKKYWRES